MKQEGSSKEKWNWIVIAQANFVMAKENASDQRWAEWHQAGIDNMFKVSINDRDDEIRQARIQAIAMQRESMQARMAVI